MAITAEWPRRSPSEEKKGKTSVLLSNVVDYSGLMSHLLAVGLINPAACFVGGQRLLLVGVWGELEMKDGSDKCLLNSRTAEKEIQQGNTQTPILFT